MKEKKLFRSPGGAAPPAETAEKRKSGYGARKRILSALLAFVMVFSLLSAFQVEAEAAAAVGNFSDLKATVTADGGLYITGKGIPKVAGVANQLTTPVNWEKTNYNDYKGNPVERIVYTQKTMRFLRQIRMPSSHGTLTIPNIHLH